MTLFTFLNRLFACADQRAFARSIREMPPLHITHFNPNGDLLLDNLDDLR
jgi:hypothetical protein